MFQDILMLAALFILRIGVPLLLVVGVGYTPGAALDGRQARLLAEVRDGRRPGAVHSGRSRPSPSILRLTSGLGAVTNLSDQFPLGMWIGFDVMAGAMLGGGAFVLAGLVYVFGLEHYRPILRSTILTAFLGYSLLIVALLIDVGRPQNIMLARPVYFPNIHSVLWEVAICVLCYTTVLALEFAPAVFERLRWKRAWQHHAQDHAAAGDHRHPALDHAPVVARLALADRARQADPCGTRRCCRCSSGSRRSPSGLSMVVVESNLSSRGLQAGPGAGPAGEAGEGGLDPAGGSTSSPSWPISSGAARRGCSTEPTLQAVLFWIEVGLCALVPAILLSTAEGARRASNALFAVGGAGRGRRHPEPVERQHVRHVELHRAGLHPVAVRDRGDRGDVHLRRRGVRGGDEVPAGLPG